MSIECELVMHPDAYFLFPFFRTVLFARQISLQMFKLVGRQLAEGGGKTRCQIKITGTTGTIPAPQVEPAAELTEQWVLTE